MTPDNTLDVLLRQSSGELAAIAASDSEFVTALYQRFPEASEHVGYNVFDSKWVQSYGRHILRVIGHLQDVQSWSFAETTVVGLTVDTLAHDLLSHLDLQPAKVFPALALAILLLRGLSDKTNREPRR